MRPRWPGRASEGLGSGVGGSGGAAMPETDVYGRAHELDPATVDVIAARLEARRERPRYMRMLHDYLDEIDLAAGGTGPRWPGRAREGLGPAVGGGGGAAMPAADVDARAHELDPATVDVLAARLEARRESPRYMRMLHDYLDEIDLAAARDVLALGAGTGVEVRELARRPGFSGRVTALEISERLVEIGRKAEEEGVADRITWRIGDAQALNLPDASFDLVTAHTL